MERFRRTLLVVAIAAISPASVGETGARVFHVGVVYNAVPPSDLEGPVPASPSARAFIEELRQRGWVDGRNVRIHWRSADQRYERRPTIFDELVRLPVDVLVASGNIATREAMARSRKVPIVTVGLISPMEQEIIASYARPGGNVTGVAMDTGGEVHGKRLALLKQIAPGVSRIASLQPWYVTQQAAEEMWPPASAAAEALGMTLFGERFGSPDDLERAIGEAVRHGANGLYAANFQPFSRKENQVRIQRAAERHRLPVIYAYQNSADNGGLIAYSADLVAAYGRAGYYVDRILRGAKPGDIPVEQPSKYELVINLKAAKTLGLKVPPSLLAEADRVVK